MENQLQVITNQKGLVSMMVDEKKLKIDADKATAILADLGVPFLEVGEVVNKLSELEVTADDQFDIMANARESRLKIQKIRTDMDKRRSALGEDHRLKVDAINFAARSIEADIKTVEAFLMKQEKYAEIKAAERAATLRAERIEKLSALTDDISLYNFEFMTAEQFDALIAQLESQKAAIAEAAKKAEAERLAEIEAEKKRQAEIEAENAKLKAEAEVREAQLAKERKIEADRLAAERAEQEKLMAAERARADEERQKREAMEAEQRAKDQADAKAKADAEESERQSLLAPDKEKIVNFANALNIVRAKAPAVKTAEAQELLNQVDVALASLAEKILAKARSL